MSPLLLAATFPVPLTYYVTIVNRHSQRILSFVHVVTSVVTLVVVFFFLLSLPVVINLSHTHTHTHIHRERERERETERERERERERETVHTKSSGLGLVIVIVSVDVRRLWAELHHDLSTLAVIGADNRSLTDETRGGNGKGPDDRAYRRDRGYVGYN